MGVFRAVLVVVALAYAYAKDDFECVAGDNSKVIFYNNELTCPPNTICNVKQKVLPRETKPRPCVGPSEICEYSCGANETLVTINTINFACGPGQICNRGKLSCEVCICPKEKFTCINERTAKVNNWEFTCGPGEKCNANYISPCTPCIKESTSITITTAVIDVSRSTLAPSTSTESSGN